MTTSRSRKWEEPGPFVQIQVSQSVVHDSAAKMDTLYAVDMQGRIWVAFQRKATEANRPWPFSAWTLLDVDATTAATVEDDIPF